MGSMVEALAKPTVSGCVNQPLSRPFVVEVGTAAVHKKRGGVHSVVAGEFEILRVHQSLSGDGELHATYPVGQVSNSVLEFAGQGDLEGASLHQRRIRTVDDHTGVEPVATWMPPVGIHNLFAL